MSPLLVALEGPAAVGKTYHCRAVAEALCREAITAAWWHSPEPSPGLKDPWSIALHHASERAALGLRLDSGWHDERVVLCDRWITSTLVHATAMRHAALGLLADAEWRVLPKPALTTVLCAPDEVLDARLASRGETVTEAHREKRRTYRSLADLVGGPTFDTSGAPAEVTARLVEVVRAALGQGRAS